MGIKQSVPKDLQKLDQDNWRQITDHEKRDYRIGNSVTFSNKMTGEQVEQFGIYFIDHEEYQSFLESCSFRNNHQMLVGIKYLNQQHSKELCSFTYHIKVYIQRIPLRLSNITDIPFPENLYILKEALTGFKILFDKVGYFRVCEEMICMSEDGTVKVWLNPDLSKNHINYYEDYNSSQTENQMVWDLIEFVDAATDKETQELIFMDFIKKDLHQTKLNFNKALNFLDLFVEKWRIDIPQYFPSIIKKIRQQKGIYDSEIDNQSSFKFLQQRSHFRAKFKQSDVVRVKTVRGDSVNSFIGSESNRTYADKLNTFDSLISNNLAFGKSINEERKKYAYRSSISLPYQDIKFIDTHRSKNEGQSEIQGESIQPDEFEVPGSPGSHIKKLRQQSIKQFPLDQEQESNNFIKGLSKIREKDSDHSLSISKNGANLRQTNSQYQPKSSRCQSFKGPAIKFSINGQYIKQIPFIQYSKSRNNSHKVSRNQSLRLSNCSKVSFVQQNQIQSAPFSIVPEKSEDIYQMKEHNCIQQSNQLADQSMDEIKTEKNYQVKVKSPPRRKQHERMTQIKGEDKNYLSIFDFEYELDPMIAADLAKYEEQKRKKGMK